MTTMKFLFNATNQTYDGEALKDIAGLKNNVTDMTKTHGISAGAIAGAMAEERMHEGVPR